MYPDLELVGLKRGSLISDGDPRDEFYIGRDNGNILLAQKLDWETQKQYSLNVSVTDGIFASFTLLNVTVIDINDHRPEFSEPLYKVEISEAVAVGTDILHLKASDRDGDGKLIFTLHAARNPASLQIFKLDSISGTLSLGSSLDRESLNEHLITVTVRDGGTPAKRNYARILIIVHDHNDHVPHFSEQILVGRLYESSAIGSAVLRAFAIDHDKGENARITYSITSGNVGNVFTIDPDLGIVQVARELDMSAASEYTLYIKATDHGNPPLSSTVPAHILLTLADNAPPKCIDKDVTAEIYEDQQVGSYVTHLQVRSSSSLQFEIVEGNADESFVVGPSTGVIIVEKELDYEVTKLYNLSVTAVNMVSHKLHKHLTNPSYYRSNYPKPNAISKTDCHIIQANKSEMALLLPYLLHRVLQA